MKSFRSIPLVMAMFAVSQLHAAIITHKVSSGISTVVADSLEKLLVPNDTLWIKADDGLASLGSGLSFETDSLTLILDADANRDGTGTLTSGFTVKSTGTNTQVRVLMGKNSKVGGTVTTPYHKDNFPEASLTVQSYPFPKPYTFILNSTGYLNLLFMINNRNDLDQLQSILAVGNGSSESDITYKSSVVTGYALGQDLDMGNTSFTPMSSSSLPFNGIFDGFHHTIQKLSITATIDQIGLFSYAEYAIFRNLNFENSNITGTEYVGTLIGRVSGAIITNIANRNGTVQGVDYVGGLIGYSHSANILTHLSNQSNIKCSNSCGGIVGFSGSDIALSTNFGNVESTAGGAGGIVGTLYGALTNGYNYGNIKSNLGSAGGLAESAYHVMYSMNNGPVTSTTNTAGGVVAFGGTPGNSISSALNTGIVTANTLAVGIAGSGRFRHTLNTGNIIATGTVVNSGKAAGIAESSLDAKYVLSSASLTGLSTEANCVAAYKSGYTLTLVGVYNADLAPSVGNTYNAAIKLDHSSIRDFENYPEPDSFKAFWHAPTSFTLPTPMNVFPDGQVYKKLRQDALVKDDTAALVLDSIHTYLPTYGNDWTYSCKARNGRATCAVAAKATTITQAYNVTGAETIVFEAAHASGLVVRDSLQVQYNVERKSAPGLSAAWPADTVVTEGTPVVLDLGQYFTDADGEAITYTLSNTKIVYSELNGDVLTLCYDKKVGTETFTVYTTDAGGRVSPVASLALTVSTLPGVLKALPVLVLKTDSVLTLDLDDYFWDADGDVLGYTVTEPKNNDVVLKGSILQIAMTSLRPDSLVITVADDDKHVLLAGLKLVNSASTVQAVHPEQRLGLELAGDLLRLTSAESATAWLRILDLQGGLRYETTLDLAVGTNALALPALPHGAYRIHVRQGDNLRTLGWEKR